MFNNEYKRSKSIDVMKCILIILVVLGHCSNVNTNLREIIFWFHMPLFFMVSGYLFKENHDMLFVKRTIMRYIIPYFSYFVFMSLLQKNLSINNVLKFLYGGRMYPEVYWFIPCLLITILVFDFLNKNISKIKVILILIFAYSVAHIESVFFIPYDGHYLSWNVIYKIPLNLDVCLISLVYFAIGFYFKNIITKIMNDTNIIIFLMVSFVCFIFIILNLKDVSSYTMDMKLSHYHNYVLDILVPCIFGVWTFMISIFISKINTKLTEILSFIGANTLPIMYMHIPLNVLIQHNIKYGVIGFILIGLIPALVFTYFCSKNRCLEFFFKGRLYNINSTTQ